MTALSVFGICAALVFVLVWIAVVLTDGGILLLVVIFPAVIAEKITGERGLEFGRKSVVYMALLFLLIAIQALVPASVFFGLYCLFFGYPLTVAASGPALPSFSASGLQELLIINEGLLLLAVYFLITFVYYSFRHKEQFRQMKGTPFFVHRILPLLSFPAGFLFLISSLCYLMDYPAGTIGPWASAAGYVYVVYLLFSLGKTIHTYSRLTRQIFAGFTFRHWFSLISGLFYNGLFLYFFWHMRPVLRH